MDDRGTVVVTPQWSRRPPSFTREYMIHKLQLARSKLCILREGIHEAQAVQVARAIEVMYHTQLLAGNDFRRNDPPHRLLTTWHMGVFRN